MSIVEHEHEHAWCASTPKRFGISELPNRGSSLKSVGTALDVLECFATDGELGVSDVARRLGVAKSTAHRVLQTLLSRGFIQQDHETGMYRLGIHIYDLGQLAQARNEVRHAAMPTLRQVARATGHTVNFAVPDGGDVVFVERIENVAGVHILGHVGRRLPAHCTSSGKVIAAFNPEAYQSRVEAGFPPRVSKTVRSLADWDRVVAQARKDGYAVSHSESFDLASSVAVAIVVRRVAVASISVFGPTEEIAPQVDRLVPLLLAASNRISRALTG
ncbi:MAG TPA: IclR family transcriptional regulator [Pengzhenrongella sp.]